VTLPRPNVAILGGGPGGYEAALVATQLGAEVTLVDEDGLGGACVLTDCVPSKTLIESSSTMTSLGRSASLGLQLADGANPVVEVDAPALNARIPRLELPASLRGAARGVEDDPGNVITDCFGANLLATGSKFNYRFKVQGSGPLSLQYEDGSGHTHTSEGPKVELGDQGSLLVNIDPRGAVTWSPALTNPK